jgi:hypothetical protein
MLVLRIRIRLDPDNLSGFVPECSRIRIRIPTLMSRIKLTGRENLTTCACWVALGRPNDKENQAKMYNREKIPLKVLRTPLKQ